MYLKRIIAKVNEDFVGAGDLGGYEFCLST